MRSHRPAFSLVELMVVVAIIGILVGVSLAGLDVARKSATRAQVTIELAQLSIASDNAKSTMSAVNVPSGAYIRSAYMLTDPAQAAELSNLRGFYGPRFGTADPSNPSRILSGLPDWGSLTGGQCMTLFLGGYCGGTFLTGSNGSSVSPFTGNPSNSTVFFDFPAKRMWYPPNGGPPVLFDQWSHSKLVDPQVPSAAVSVQLPGMPYLYFSSRKGGDYPYGYCTVLHGTYTNYLNPSYQVTVPFDQIMQPLQDATGKYYAQLGSYAVSFGMDGMVGAGGVWMPGAGSYTGGAFGFDDQVSGYSSTMGTAR